MSNSESPAQLDNFKMQTIKATRQTSDNFMVTFQGSQNGEGSTPKLIPASYNPTDVELLWNLGNLDDQDLYQAPGTAVDFGQFNNPPYDGEYASVQVSAMVGGLPEAALKAGIVIKDTPFPPPTSSSYNPNQNNQQITNDLIVSDFEIKKAGANLQIKFTYSHRAGSPYSYSFANEIEESYGDDFNLLKFCFDPTPLEPGQNGPANQQVTVTIPNQPDFALVVTFMEESQSGLMPMYKKGMIYIDA